MKKEKVEEIDQFLKENFSDFKLMFGGGMFCFFIEGWKFKFVLKEDFGIRNFSYLGVEKEKEKKAR